VFPAFRVVPFTCSRNAFFTRDIEEGLLPHMSGSERENWAATAKSYQARADHCKSMIEQYKEDNKDV
jgi:hypothetical protein